MGHATHPTWTVTTGAPEETRALGVALGNALHGGEVLLLSGPLGAGKTTLTQGIAEGLGFQGYAKSPSFVLVHEYQGRVPLYHMDLFRLQGPEEVWDLGLDDYLQASGVLVVEWAEKGLSAFPPDRLRVAIEAPSETERAFTFVAEGPDAAAALGVATEDWRRQQEGGR